MKNLEVSNYLGKAIRGININNIILVTAIPFKENKNYVRVKRTVGKWFRKKTVYIWKYQHYELVNGLPYQVILIGDKVYDRSCLRIELSSGKVIDQFYDLDDEMYADFKAIKEFNPNIRILEVK